MVVQTSEVVAKGNRQFAGSGRWKLAGLNGFGYSLPKMKGERDPKNG